MGVSGLLREILKKYPSIHLPVPHPTIKIDYLFIYFNAFLFIIQYTHFQKMSYMIFPKIKKPLPMKKNW